MKKYKYRRSDFSTQEEYEKFRVRASKANMTWRKKLEEANPELRERRILRQRIYARYYYGTDGRLTFAQWLSEKGIEDFYSMSVTELGDASKKIALKC